MRRFDRGQERAIGPRLHDAAESVPPVLTRVAESRRIGAERTRVVLHSVASRCSC